MAAVKSTERSNWSPWTGARPCYQTSQETRPRQDECAQWGISLIPAVIWARINEEYFTECPVTPRKNRYLGTGLTSVLRERSLPKTMNSIRLVPKQLETKANWQYAERLVQGATKPLSAFPGQVSSCAGQVGLPGNLPAGQVKLSRRL